MILKLQSKIPPPVVLLMTLEYLGKLSSPKIRRSFSLTIEWSKSNNMELHEQKFEFLSYRLPANAALCKALPFQDNLTNYTTPSGVEIERKSLVRDLGVLVSDGFTWTPHVNKMVIDARKMASWTLGVFRDRSKVVMLQLYKSLIRSKLEYCCPLWNPSLVQDIQTIEDVQRYFTNRISGMSDLSYWERLSALASTAITSTQKRTVHYHTHLKDHHGICTE